MKNFSRRTFLSSGAAGLAAVTASAEETPSQQAASTRDVASAVDFRYAPASGQATYCFPDDPFKSIVGERGELRYGPPNRTLTGPPPIPVTVEFSALGMDPDIVTGQRLESPEVPVIHTRIERPEAVFELTTFATRGEAEGRIDNTIFEIRPKSKDVVYVIPTVTLRTRRTVVVQKSWAETIVRLDGDGGPVFCVIDAPFAKKSDSGVGITITMNEGAATSQQPLRCFVRFPQEGQQAERICGRLNEPSRLLHEARVYWQNWQSTNGGVSWKLPGRYGEFLTACARNIQQSRERHSGKLVFQVGPTVYRGLWVVDGNFILEAARYLGYDEGVREGLDSTWALQDASGCVFALAGREHWKDTGIAIFTVVRQAELSQDWSLVERMRPEVLKAVGFLKTLRDKARTGNNACGRYGLLAPGFGDGGLGGVRSEFTNTIWVLAGLKALADAAVARRLAGFEAAGVLYRELRSAFDAAARAEMRHHPAGFDYLPMLMKDDPQWNGPERERLPLQCGQWALSHAIYPGLVFAQDDPIVRGHIALMQASTREEIPAETGWIHREGVWNYNAAFVAHVYLWAGVTDWARTCFHGFLNHATPLYCWREEQPLKGSMLSGYVGDMPHNWASAECILYLRHMLALEDGRNLRLLSGIQDAELAAGEPYHLAASPTRFGKLGLQLDPLDRRQGWRLQIDRGKGPAPDSVRLPAVLGSRGKFSGITGASFQQRGEQILVDPASSSWTATWKG